MPPAVPSLDEFLAHTKPLNPGYSDSDIAAQYHTLYPSAAPDGRTPSFESFLAETKPLNPGYSDEEIHQQWQDRYGVSAPEKDLGFTGTLLEGTKSMGRSVLAAGQALVGDEEGVVETAKAQGRAPQDPALTKLLTDIQAHKEANPDASWFDAGLNVGKEAIKNPKGAALLLTEQLPNSAAVLGSAGAGAAIGSLAGPVGTVVGGIAGLFLGDIAVETGGKVLEAAADQTFTPEERAQTLKEGAIKGSVVGALDTATFGLTKWITGTVGRAIERATVDVLTKEGIDVADKTAVLAARENPAIKAKVIDAQTAARNAATTIGQRVFRGAGEAGLETLGEGTGEYLGEVAATGKGDKTEAIIEAFAGLGQSAAEIGVAAGMSRAKAAALTEPQGGAPAGDPLRQAEPIIGAENVDDAIKKAQDVTGQPGVTPEVLDEFIARQSGEGKEIAKGLTEDAQHKADQEAFVDVMGRMATLGEITLDDDGLPVFKGSPLRVIKPSELPITAEGNVLTQDQHTVLSALANAFGKRIVIFQDDPAYELPSGLVNRPSYPDVIFVAKDTKAVDHFSVFAHEALHLMKGTEFHTEFLKSVFEQLTPEAKTLAVKRHGQLSDERLLNEVASDVAGTELHKPELWMKVYKNLEERVGTEEAKAQTLTFIDHLKEIIAKIKAVIVSQPWGPRRPGAMDKRTLAEQYLKDITKVHDALAAGVADSLYAAKHGTIQKRAEMGRLELRRRQVEVKPKKQTTSKVLGTDEEFEAYTARTKEFLANTTIPPYAKQAIMSQEMMLRTNKQIDLHLSDAKWEKATINLEDLKKGNEVLFKQPSTFQHRVSMTQGPIVLDRSGTIIDGNNRVFEAIRRGDTEIGVIRPEGSEKKPSGKPAKKVEKKVTNKPEEVNKKPEATEKPEESKPVLIADLHDLADARGIAWDNDNKFMDLTERTTGKRHLDDLTQAERQTMAEKIKETPIQKSAQKAEGDVQSPEVREGPALSRAEQSPPADTILYHVTRTSAVPNIREKGLLTFQTTNWIKAGNKSRYGNGEVFAFTHRDDAIRWASKMDWEFNKEMGSGKISVVSFNRGSGKWKIDTADPLSQMGSKGKWLKLSGAVAPSDILDAEEITHTHVREMAARLRGEESSASTVALEHYSREAGLTEIRPDRQGTGQIGEERRRMINEGTRYLPRSYFYRAGTKPEARFKGLTKYTANVPAGRLVDLATLTGTPTERELQAKKLGYLGFFNSESSQPDAVALFKPVQTEESSASPAEPWFSSMRKVLEQKMPSKASKTQVLNLLKSPGVKEDEIRWSGIQDYLAQQGDIIDKHNLLAWLAAHNVQVEEVVKGAGSKLGDPGLPVTMTIQEFNDRWNANGTHPDFDGVKIDSGVKQGRDGYLVHVPEGYLGQTGTRLGAVRLRPDAWLFNTFNEASEAAYEYLVAEPARGESDARGEGDTQYEGYTLPGGTDYTELLLKLPSKMEMASDARGDAFMKPRSPEYKSPHFEEPNILAHVRFKTRQDGAGKTVLFLEEVQSDWHEQGREKGYLSDHTAEKYLKDGWTARLVDGLWEIHDPKGLFVNAYRWEGKDIRSEKDAFEEYAGKMKYNSTLVPDAPFKTTWPELVMKRMLRWAAEHNYDRLAWTTGAQQNERYGLAKYVKEITINRNKDGSYHFTGHDKNDRMVSEEKYASPQLVVETIGKELGVSAMAQADAANGKVVNISGEGLSIGGSGMKYFYDQMLPRFMEKYLKRWGTKVDTLEINTNPNAREISSEGVNTPQRGVLQTVHSIALTDDMKDSVMNEGQPLFSPAQIPSGLPNAGNINQGYAIEPPGKLDTMIRILQDKNIDIKRIVEALQSAGKIVPEDLNPVYREEMYQKRVAQRAKDFTVDELRPLVEAMRLHKVTLEQLDDYAHARHVVTDKLNARLKALNPNMPNNDALSGLTDAQAQNILAQSNKPVMDSLMRRVDDMVERTRDLMVSYGLEKQATIDQWRQDYSSYVPLHREGFEEEGYPTGTGRSVRGSTVQRRGGSNIAVENILANIAQARDQILTRGEKQKPVIAFAGLMMLHPNPQLAILDKPAAVTMTNPVTGLQMVVPGNLASYQVPTVRRFDPVSQTFKMYPDPMYKGRDNVVNFRIKGVDYAIVFNEKNERAMEVAKAFKELDTAKLNIISRALAPITRYLAAINTQYNPIFGLVNFVRDTQFAMLTLSSTPLAGQQATVLKNALGSLSGIYQDARDVRLGIAPTSPMAKLWKRFEEVGGPTGYRDLFKTSTERAAEIERMLDPKSWKKVRNPIDLGKRLEETPMFQWLSDYNLTMENSIRLGVFKTAIDAGMSDLKAASLAKNITVNFSKKGQIGALMGSLYAFFNANVQGTARIAETLFERTPNGFKISSAGKKIIVGGIVLGVLQTFALAMAGFDDHDPPEFVKQKNLILPMPGTEKGYVMIPMPLGFNLLPNIGRLAAETMMNFAQGRPPKVMEKAASLLSTMFNTLSPTGGSGGVIQELSPTAVDPIVALATNKDWTGRAIYKEDFSSLKPTPGYTRSHDTATAWAKGLSYAINWATGGSDFTPGVLSPTPDAVDYLITQATGGIGREVSKTAQVAHSAYTGEELPTHKIPLAGRFYGSATGASAVRSRFYDDVRRVNISYAEFEGRALHHQPFSEYVKTHPAARFAKAALKVEEDLGVLAKQKQLMLERDASKEAIKLQEAKITGLMKRFSDLVAVAEK